MNNYPTGSRIVVMMGRPGSKVACIGTVVEPGNARAFGGVCKVRLDTNAPSRLAGRCIVVSATAVIGEVTL